MELIILGCVKSQKNANLI